MGFIKEVYSNNRAGLIVAFGRGETTTTYYNGDDVEGAMKHFNMYLRNNQLYIKTEDEQAIQKLAIKAEDASEFRSTVNAIITTLSDKQAIEAPILFPIWKAGVEYKVGDRVRYNNRLYKVIQDHTSQETWAPVEAVSLFTSLLIDEENNTLSDWVQPDSTNAYMIGDKVIFNGTIYESLIDNNVWSPVDYPAGWTPVTEEEEGE